MIELQSTRRLQGNNVSGLLQRSVIRSEGYSRAAGEGRPLKGICNSWSEVVNCDLHFQALSAAVKRGVLEAGGVPLQFPAIALDE